jgi:heme-degrading monooxygenase HmoA
MATIAKEAKLVTLINVFTVKPEQQQEVVDLLIEATEKVVSKQPGYISANIHKSLDGTKVVNYAQWRSREEFEAAFARLEVKAHTNRAYELAISIEPHLYEVVFTDGG